MIADTLFPSLAAGAGESAAAALGSAAPDPVLRDRASHLAAKFDRAGALPAWCVASYSQHLRCFSEGSSS